jgi:hypothetical protein
MCRAPSSRSHWWPRNGAGDVWRHNTGGGADTRSNGRRTWVEAAGAVGRPNGSVSPAKNGIADGALNRPLGDSARTESKERRSRHQERNGPRNRPGDVSCESRPGKGLIQLTGVLISRGHCRWVAAAHHPIGEIEGDRTDDRNALYKVVSERSGPPIAAAFAGWVTRPSRAASVCAR